MSRDGAACPRHGNGMSRSHTLVAVLTFACLLRLRGLESIPCTTHTPTAGEGYFYSSSCGWHLCFSAAKMPAETIVTR